MPHTPEELASFYVRAYGISGDPGAMFDGHVARLDGIVAQLRRLDVADHLRIFGSALVEGSIPNDVDVYFEVPRRMDPMTIARGEADLLDLARRYSREYAFDPFVLSSDRRTLLCRNVRGTAWTEARGRRELVAAGRSGVPLSEFGRVFREEFAYDRVAPDPATPAF